MEPRTWLASVAEQLQGGREDVCEFGHRHHDTIHLKSKHLDEFTSFDLSIFNWFRYETTEPGWCTGKDEVSKGIQHAGYWEEEDTRLIMQALRRPRERDVVIDCGSHIGWYTLVSVSFGYDVLAIDASPEHLEVLKENIVTNFSDYSLHPRPILCRGWIDKDSIPVEDADIRVRLLKLDIEGQEPAALKVFAQLFEHERVEAVLLEVTPPNLPNAGTDIVDGNLEAVKMLENWGLTPHIEIGEGQANYLFTR